MSSLEEPMLSLPAARDTLTTALSDAIFVMVMTTTLPEPLVWWLLRQLVEADTLIAAGLQPEVWARLPTAAPDLGDSLHQSEGARIADALLRALTLALDTLTSEPDPAAQDVARWAVLGQLAADHPPVAALLTPAALERAQQALEAQEEE
jgi:hypothetical protein